MPDWLEFLAARGANISDSAVSDFGDPKGEIASAASGSVLADLSYLGLLRFSGADAIAFLHGQVSTDVKGLGPAQGRYGGYCTPKGRLLANFLLWRDGDSALMMLSRDILPAVQERLRMFVLRSKVSIDDVTGEFALMGASGPAAAEPVGRAVGAIAPAQVFGVARGESGIAAVRVPRERFVVAAPRFVSENAWTTLAETLRPVGTSAWQWLEIANGLPLITAATQDELVPQMANLELIGGVSFDKGCYPGQEVVARSQYLGKVKRRTYLASVAAEEAPRAGEPLYEEGGTEQTAGIVLNTAPSPNGGYDVLAVMQSTAADGGRVHLRRADGPLLRVLPLPYAIP